jgi:hypothetical protein
MLHFADFFGVVKVKIKPIGFEFWPIEKPIEKLSLKETKLFDT